MVQCRCHTPSDHRIQGGTCVNIFRQVSEVEVTIPQRDSAGNLCHRRSFHRSLLDLPFQRVELELVFTLFLSERSIVLTRRNKRSALDQIRPVSRLAFPRQCRKQLLFGTDTVRSSLCGIGLPGRQSLSDELLTRSC